MKNLTKTTLLLICATTLLPCLLSCGGGEFATASIFDTLTTSNPPPASDTLKPNPPPEPLTMLNPPASDTSKPNPPPAPLTMLNPAPPDPLTITMSNPAPIPKPSPPDPLTMSNPAPIPKPSPPDPLTMSNPAPTPKPSPPDPLTMSNPAPIPKPSPPEPLTMSNPAPTPKPSPPEPLTMSNPAPDPLTMTPEPLTMSNPAPTPKPSPPEPLTMSNPAPTPKPSLPAPLTMPAPSPTFTAQPFISQNGGVTQSSQVDSEGVTEDSISVVKNSNGNLVFNLVTSAFNLVDLEFTITNSNGNWIGDEISPPDGYRITSHGVFFDGATYKAESRIYKHGDFYAITGFWINEDNPHDFGVFIEANPRTADLPTSGSATYTGNGNLRGIYRITQPNAAASSDILTSIFRGRLNLHASFNSDNKMQTRADLYIRKKDNPPFIRDIQFSFNPIIDGDGDGSFIGGDITCASGCDNPSNSSWGGRFAGDPITTAGGLDSGATTGDWPAGFIGTFGFQGVAIDDKTIDAIGEFRSIHSSLCAATRSC